MGLNCAACHVGEVTSAPGAASVRVLGVTSHFDAEAFFGSVIVSTFRTSDPANMKKFLAAYLAENDSKAGDEAQQLLTTEWQRQEQKIIAAISDDPSGSKDIAPGALHKITGTDLRLNRRLSSTARTSPRCLIHS